MTDAPPTPTATRDFILTEARRLGFNRAAVIPLAPPRSHERYSSWLAADYAGTMTYLASPEHVASRANLREVCASARCAVVVAMAYPPGSASDRDTRAVRGSVARYARGADYHVVMKRRLHALAESVSVWCGRPVSSRPCVDTAPVLERDLAERAGIGFIAKNTMLITPGLGSYTLLGELLLDVEVPAAGPPMHRRCGRCTRCIDACPTSAFPEPRVLDSRRCISYLTIEHRGEIPHELRSQMGTMVFGCDRCQEVCPFNAAAPTRAAIAPELTPRDRGHVAPDLIALLEQGANQRRRYVDGTALRRVNREQLLRNVCVALGNAGDGRAVGPLTRKLTDRSPIVRSHASWALGQIRGAKTGPIPAG